MPRPNKVPGVVPQEAIDYLEAKDITLGFSYLDVWREEHATAFTVAKIMELNILVDVQNSLIDNLKQGQTFKSWVKGINATLDKSGWSAYGKDRPRPNRLNVIYDTNLRGARAVGQWQRIERTQRSHPFLEYALGPSEKHRVLHEEIAGTILPVNDMFWDSYAPQNGYLCKCFLIQVSRVVAERKGGVTPRPDTTPVAWKNPRSGKTEMIPKGIDPGFNTNPGKNRAQVLKTAQANAQHDWNEAQQRKPPKQ